MNVVATALAGVFEIEFDRIGDDRGYFVRVFDHDVFAQHGLCTTFPEHSEAHNARAGTVRGLHWQRAPYGEVKVIRCVRGAAYDVLVDLRPQSPTAGRWAAFDLTETASRALYVPPGIAHGYQTLTGDTAFAYLISERYRPDAACGVAHDSPLLGIRWPLPVAVISARDRALPPFTPDRLATPESP